jgi:tryptophanyl-tRNA synthetase
MRQRVFSGVQPTGNLHIGNYLAAIRHWATSQLEYDTLFCIVDLHAITIPQDPQALRAKTREVAGLLFAAGIDPPCRRCLFNRTSALMPNWPGSSTASRPWAGWGA